MLFVTSQITIPSHELHFDFVRSSGPGGQNVNKVNSKAQLHWNFLENTTLSEAVRVRFLNSYSSKLTKNGEILISSDRFRDRIRNQEDCLEKLKQMLLKVAVAPKLRKKTKPTKSSKEKRHTFKRKQGEKKKNRAGKNWDK